MVEDKEGRFRVSVSSILGGNEQRGLSQGTFVPAPA